MASPRQATDRALVGSVAFWVAAFLPPVAMLVLINRLAVNVPFQDDWDMLTVVTKWRAGTVTFGDFWQQHSEHRVVALKAVIWAIGGLTDYSLIAEMFVGFTFAAITYVLVVDLLRLSLKTHAPRLVAPLALASSLLLFSLAQHESWFWGTASLEFFLINLCTISLIWMLTRWADAWPSLAAAAGCAVVGMFTEVSGQVLWLTGAIGIELLSQTRTGRLQRLAVWAAAGWFMFSTSIWDLHWGTSSLGAAVFQPRQLIVFAGACLGLPFASFASPPWSAALGWGGCAVLCLAAWHVHTYSPSLFRKLQSVLLLGGHALAVSMLIAIGRAGGDPQSALTSHYSYAPTLFWIAVLVVGSAAYATGMSALPRRTRAIGAAFAAGLVASLAVAFTRANIGGYRESYARSQNLRMALAALVSEDPPPRAVLRYVYPPDEDRPERLLVDLRAFRLGPFSDRSEREVARTTAQFTATPSTGSAEGFHDGGDCDGTTGWAWDPAHPNSPVALDVWVGDTRLGTVTANWFRWDLLAAGMGNGQHAFRFLFPAQAGLGTGHAVTVTFAGTHRPLPGSPKIVSCRD